MDIRSATFILGATSESAMPGDGRPEAAFVGRSNVGKSSLINTLLGRKKLARTSGTPGKTREINFYLINDAFYVVDLPGFGYARRSRADRAKWQKQIGRYVTSRQALRVVFQLIDGRHAPTALDREALLLLRESEAARIVLLTKIDKLSGNTRSAAVRRMNDTLSELQLELPVVLTSARDGRGRSEILGWMQTLLV